MTSADDPIAISVSAGSEKGKRENRLVIITDLMLPGDTFGATVNSLNDTAIVNRKRVKSNVTVTAFQKTDAGNYIVTAAERRLLYLDKKEAGIYCLGDSKIS